MRLRACARTSAPHLELYFNTRSKCWLLRSSTRNRSLFVSWGTFRHEVGSVQLLDSHHVVLFPTPSRHPKGEWATFCSMSGICTIHIFRSPPDWLTSHSF
jgi:hypothetical protein